MNSFVRIVLTILVALSFCARSSAFPFAPEGGCAEKSLAAEELFFRHLEKTADRAPFKSTEPLEIFYGMLIVQCQTDALTDNAYANMSLSDRLARSRSESWFSHLRSVGASPSILFEYVSECVPENIREACIESF